MQTMTLSCGCILVDQGSGEYCGVRGCDCTAALHCPPRLDGNGHIIWVYDDPPNPEGLN